MACCCVTAGKDLSLSYEDPDVFGRSQWRIIPRWLFVVYRVAVATYFFGFCAAFIIVSMVDGLGGDFFVYLTNWGFISVTLYFFVAATSTLYHAIVTPQNTRRRSDSEDPDETTPLTASHDDNEDRHTPWYFRMSWCLFNIAALAAIVITLVYWPALSGLDMDVPFVLDFHIHAMNSIAIGLELLLAAMPIRMVHAFYTLALGIVYFIVTIIVYFSGWQNPYNHEKYVYPFLDYSEDPLLAVAALVAIVIGIFLLQTVLWALFKIKRRLAGEHQPITDQSHSSSSSYPVKMEKGIDSKSHSGDEDHEVDTTKT